MTNRPPGNGPDGGPANQVPGQGGVPDPSVAGWASPTGWEQPVGQQPTPPNTFLPQGQQPPAWGPVQTGYGGQGQAPAGGSWQSGYGQPPAGGQWQGGYGPQPGAYPGWSNQPPRRRGRGCIIAVLVFLVAIVIGVGGCTWLVVDKVAPAVALEMSIRDRSSGEIQNVSYNWTNGVGTFTFSLAPGVSTEEGRNLACKVVRPALKGTEFEGDRFVIYDDYGTAVAIDRTPCS
jgi:hypothetical protein